jgi:uncharacterized protein (DUF58 family)
MRGDAAAARRGSERELPSPGVRFGASFVRRLEALVLRLAAARELREGQGAARIHGVGEEFAGYRPYRPGEDLRQLDWNLLARLDQPFVRVERREAAESWCVLVDASASMGVGAPGKLQLAAELACAVACVGLRSGAHARVVASSTQGPRAFHLRRKSDLPALFLFLEATRAEGDAGLASLTAGRVAPHDAGRVFVLGDLVDVEPEDVGALFRRGRELFVAQVLAPEELRPEGADGVLWVDPESGARVSCALDRSTRTAYERELEALLETWREWCARHSVPYTLAASATPFEDVARTWLA